MSKWVIYVITFARRSAPIASWGTWGTLSSLPLPFLCAKHLCNRPLLSLNYVGAKDCRPSSMGRIYRFFFQRKTASFWGEPCNFTRTDRTKNMDCLNVNLGVKLPCSYTSTYFYLCLYYTALQRTCLHGTALHLQCSALTWELRRTPPREWSRQPPRPPQSAPQSIP